MGDRNNAPSDYNIKVFGEELHRYRLDLGWTAKQLAILYSEAIGREDNLVAVSYVYGLEAGRDMVVNKGRRAILARLVGMPLATAGVTLLPAQTTNPFIPERVDANEYGNMLEVYCSTWQVGTTYKATQDIKKRISSLENEALYNISSEKKQFTELLCGYQIVAADLAAEQNTLRAIPILSKAIQLSKQMNIPHMYAHSLRQRAGAYIDTFEETRDYNLLKNALVDFQATEGVHARLSPFYQGLVDVRRGLVYACLAQDKHDFTKALKIIDSSSEQVGKQSDDPRVAARLDEERYRFNRAAAFLYSPQGSPELALKELDQATDHKPATSPRRGVHRDLLYAETYAALQDYPLAIACAASAVETSTANGMDTLFNRLENVYQIIRKSSFGNDAEVARLGTQIFKAHHPELFS